MMLNEETQKPLGRFGHHPDPAIDYCVEIDALEAMASEVAMGIECEHILHDRLERAMAFRVGGDQHAVAARRRLLRLEVL